MTVRRQCFGLDVRPPKDLHETREQLKSLGYGVSELEHRDYGQTEFFLTDDDGYSHCFGVPTET